MTGCSDRFKKGCNDRADATVRMRTPRSVFSAHWLNTLFHDDVLIARIHHLLLSRSFRRPPPLAHLFHFVNLPAASNPACLSHLLVMSQNPVFQNSTLIRLYRYQNSQNRVLFSRTCLWYYRTIKKSLEKNVARIIVLRTIKIGFYLSEEAWRGLSNTSLSIQRVQLWSHSAGRFDDSQEASVNRKERHNVRLMPLAKLSSWMSYSYTRGSCSCFILESWRCGRGNGEISVRRR